MRELVDPQLLISPARIDCVAKYRFFRSLLTGMDVEQAEQSYRWHILQRTGGREPVNFHGEASTKSVVDDYVAGARALLASLQARGFDPDYPVPIGADGRLLDGAHRVSACAALEIPIAIERHEPAGYAWDFDWFKERGASKAELARLLYAWVRMKPNASVFVLWGPALHAWDAMQAQLQPEFETVGSVDLAFATDEADAFASLVFDCYALDTPDLAGMLRYISQKVDRLAESPMFVRIIVGHCLSGAEAASAAANAVKDRLRALVHPQIDRSLFISCHASASHDEALYLAEVFLNPVNIAHARLRRQRQPRDQFVRWCTATRSKVLELGLQVRQVCVVGSGALEAVGLRHATDIDITLTSDLRRELFDTDVTKVQADLDVVTEGYHRTASRPWIPDDHLIESPENHFMLLGLKFAALDIVRDRKQHSGRPKDLLDVELLDRFIDTRALKP